MMEKCLYGQLLKFFWYTIEDNQEFEKRYGKLIFYISSYY